MRMELRLTIAIGIRAYCLSRFRVCTWRAGRRGIIGTRAAVCIVTVPRTSREARIEPRTIHAHVRVDEDTADWGNTRRGLQSPRTPLCYCTYALLCFQRKRVRRVCAQEFALSGFVWIVVWRLYFTRRSIAGRVGQARWDCVERRISVLHELDGERHVVSVD